MRIAAVAAVVAMVSLNGSQAASPAQSDRLLLDGYDFTYNMDYPEALHAFEEAIRAHPQSPEAYRGLATLTWLYILFQRGVVTVDDYVGHMSRSDVQMPPVPQAEATRFKTNTDKALALSEQAVAHNWRSAQAHYDVGATVGLLATYAGSVEGRVVGGLQAARRAYAEQEEVLSLDPRRKDAGLIVGTYRYFVASLPLPLRLLAYVVGFSGDKERGVQMIEEAAAYPGDSQADAKFALVLFYNRDQRWGEALGVIRELQARFPRNRLLWLEAGATALRADRPAEAETELDTGIAKLQRDTRARSFGEEPLWYYKRGAARVLLGHAAGAEVDLKHALEGKGHEWVKGRTHMELGKLADLAGDRARAQAEYQAAISIGGQDKDESAVEQATALLTTPYRRR